VFDADVGCDVGELGELFEVVVEVDGFLCV